MLLSNGCSFSELTVHPKNWMTGKQDLLKQTWYIQYYFRDPAFKDKYKYGKLIIIKGMNQYRTLIERRQMTQHLIDNEIRVLTQNLYNPITKAILDKPIEQLEINEDLLFIEALTAAAAKLKVSKSMQEGIDGTIKAAKKAALSLRYDLTRISDIKIRHIKALLEEIQKTNSKVSGNRYNKHRSHMLMIFKELIQWGACESNPVRDISKQKTTKNIRKILTAEECQLINETVLKYDRNFWRLIHIFFHSGARTTELFKVQGKHVDLKKQSVRYLVLKKKVYEWIERPIKDIALPLWMDAMEYCSPEDYVFGKGLLPGSVSIRPDQMTRRWRRHIKDKLKIEADWYALKHLNTTQSMIQLERVYDASNDIAKMNGHNSAMVINIYDVNNKERQNERVKKITNAFGNL